MRTPDGPKKIKPEETQLTAIDEALLLQSSVINLQTPGARVLAAITGWFNMTRPFVGYTLDLFKPTEDLVVLRTAPDQDRLSKFLQSHLGYALRVGSLIGFLKLRLFHSY